MLRLFVKPFLGPPFPIGFQRAWSRLVSGLNPRTKAASTRKVEIAGMPAVRAWPRGTDPENVLLYFHGGGYCIGSWQTHAGLITHLAVAADAIVYAPSYRLAPEHPHPAALDDALRAYRWLLDQGVPSERIALGGDSAGGGLALATARALRDAKLPPPASIALISPWVDLRGDTPSMTTHARIDPMIRTSWSRACARLYLNGRDPNDPACSPLFAKHEGSAPLLIHVGTDEAILDDSTRLAERCKAAGVDVTLRVFERMWHEFQIHAGIMQEADDAVQEIGRFLKAHFAE